MGQSGFGPLLILAQFPSLLRLPSTYGGSGTALRTLLESDYSLEMALLLRAYGKGYTATHAAASSTLTGCYNQYGTTAIIKYIPSRGWTMHLSAEYSAYPWSRYRIDGPSWDSRARFDIMRESRNGSQLQLRLDWRHKSESDPL